MSKQASGVTQSISARLDFIRGIAALIVYASHLRLFFFAEYQTLSSPSMGVKVFYLVTKLGHAAVMVFFVLSGYLVGGSVIKGLAKNDWQWSSYLFRRGTRLYIVLVPALILTASLDQAALYWHLSAPWSAVGLGPSAIAQRDSMKTFVANLSFLQTIASNPYGSNTALWSLSWEWWYYILFPCILLSFRSRGRFLYLALSTALVVLLGWQIILYFGIWLLGALLASISAEWGKGLKTPLTVSLMTLTLIWAATNKHFDAAFVDFAVGISTALVILGVIGNSRATAATYSFLAKWLAESSYTLYVVHMPLLFLIAGIARVPWQPTPVNFTWLALVAAVGLIYARLIFLIAESRTELVRSILLRARQSRSIIAAAH